MAAAGLATAAATGAGAATTGCQVTYTVGSQWPSGFTANVAVKNLGDPVSSWQLGWTFPAGQRVTQGWNASITSSGDAVTASNASWNGSLPTNGTASFGFNGSWTGSNPSPASFTLNGATCTGSVDPTTPPTTEPSTPPSTPPTTEPSTPPTGEPQNAAATVAAMQPGWNLGNTLDAVGADETAWGNPRITEELLEGVKAQGFKSIRIPVTWSAQQGGAPSYTINAAYLNRVKEVVDWALEDGLYVMINIHHDSWQWINTMPTDHDNVLARYNATWEQIASTFRTTSDKLIFESVNEPQFTGSSGDAQNASLLNELNTSFRSIVRDSGGTNATRLIVLPTLHTSSDQVHLDNLATTVAALNDNNLAVTTHFYGYWPFSVNIAGTTTFDATTQKDLTDVVDRNVNTFVSKGIPVIVGEYGLLGFDRSLDAVEQGEKLKFFEYYGYYTRLKGITTMLWDNGQHLDRTALTWRDVELYNQIKSSWTVRSGTASTDQVFVAKSAAIAAKTVTLNLNGTSLTAVRHNGTDLVQGTDYTVSGDQLTLTADAVTTLVGDRTYGTNAQLQLVFSAGVPWRINIITYDSPVVSAATGTTAAFAIPTAFNGDRVATMEAKYADGTNAGPQNWTSFKEFAYTFLPDYTAGTVKLTPEFFADVNDSAKVTLTLHFWSGAKLTYYVTKSGSNVTGSIS
ncbi:cellulase family glycosylhydrolase [Paractinoplanes rishiriensis]|uniref:cellulase family glycosylhydrolase n=1 Tax=Paractinoplanes rishiriensis TaxID=1050105 RepID=UPI003F68CE3B